MTARTWLYSQLSTIALPYSAHTRVFAKKSMSSAKEDHPFVVFKLGNDTNEELAETIDVHRQYFQIWVHDYSDTKIGDYTRIDEVLRTLKLRFDSAKSPLDGIIATRYLETSQDLDDATLSTVFKYIRFQFIMKE